MRKSKISNAFSFIVCMLIVALGVGFVCKATNNFERDFNVYRVYFNGNEMSTSDEVTLIQGQENIVYVDSLLGEVEASDYSVKIVTNSEYKDTTFTIKVPIAGGSSSFYYDRLSLKDIPDFNDFFSLSKDGNKITFSLPDKVSTLYQVLNLYYQNGSYTERISNLPADYNRYSEVYFFTLQIIVGESVYDIDMNMNQYFALTGLNVREGVIL